jgi:predicted HicB family RNase H-like nuclease
MKLSQVNEAMDHQITGGSDYHWNCFPDARFLDYESEYAHVSVLYSTVDQTVYQADASIKRGVWPDDERFDKPYRWTNPTFNDAYLSESKERGIEPNQAWDDVKWILLETDEDFLEKSKAMFTGNYWDTRIQVPVDLDDSIILTLALEAHKRDITLNKMVEIVLQEAITKYNVNGTLD